MKNKQDQCLEGFEQSNEDKWNITDFDITVGKRLWKEQQFEIKDESDIFNVFIYCLLAGAERAMVADKFYRLLKREDFLKPDKLLNVFKKEELDEKEQEIKSSFFKLHWPNQRRERVVGFIQWWQTNKGQEFTKELSEDMFNGRENAVHFRDTVVDSVSGFSYKSASYLLNKIGYDDVVPIDVWEIRFLRDLYFPEIPNPDYKKVRGITDRKLYLKCENKLKEIALEKGLSAGEFHCAVWGKYARWK
jgi:thermostable 8-oxoguanine DNA glycosylase